MIQTPDEHLIVVDHGSVASLATCPVRKGGQIAYEAAQRDTPPRLTPEKSSVPLAPGPGAYTSSTHAATCGLGHRDCAPSRTAVVSSAWPLPKGALFSTTSTRSWGAEKRHQHLCPPARRGSIRRSLFSHSCQRSSGTRGPAPVQEARGESADAPSRRRPRLPRKIAPSAGTAQERQGHLVFGMGLHNKGNPG
jgi:hypothetical protein